jgi:hypothetical protein
MVAVLWLLDAQKGCGLGSGTIRGVSASSTSSFYFLTQDGRLAMRRVLHLRMVTQCAMLEDFGIFLVLADKVAEGVCSVAEVPLITFLVSLCLPYRSTRAFITWGSECFTDTTKT